MVGTTPQRKANSHRVTLASDLNAAHVHRAIQRWLQTGRPSDAWTCRNAGMCMQLKSRNVWPRQGGVSPEDPSAMQRTVYTIIILTSCQEGCAVNVCVVPRVAKACTVLSCAANAHMMAI